MEVSWSLLAFLGTKVMTETDFLSYLKESYLMKLTAPMSVQLALKSRDYFYVPK